MNDKSLFDEIDALLVKYECFHLITPELDIMGQSPLYEIDQGSTLNEFMWIITVADSVIGLNHCMAGFEPDHYDRIIIPLPVNGYPPEELDYIWDIVEGVEYEDSSLLIIKHKNTNEKIVSIEFFN